MSQSRWFFALTVFLGSFLLFLVEPIAARQLLPVLGGSASVWITCLVFFQTALLLGYLYAHWLTRRPRTIFYAGSLAVAIAGPLAWTTSSFEFYQGSAHPVWTVFELLGVWIGLPFIVLAATSPLLQVWRAQLEEGRVPYRLYALSNLGSLLALGLYPTVIEPRLTLHAQRVVWSCGFLIFIVLAGGLARLHRKSVSLPPSIEKEDSSIPCATLAHKLLWVLLPMGAAMQLSAVTAYLTANVAAIPLLWVLPLGAYLLTLIVSFQFRVVLPWAIFARVLVVLLGALAYSLSKTNSGWPLWVSLIFFLGELFFACIFCHSEAVRLRPDRPSESTLFYLLFAAGGAFGSFLIGIAAPLVSSYNLDLPITFFVTALLALLVNWGGGWNQRLLWIVASAAMVVVTFMVRYSYRHDSTVAVRNFYASLRVTQDLFSYPGATVRTLLNGSIQHGSQIYGTDELRHTPTTYYAPDSGIGLALRYCCLMPDPAANENQDSGAAQPIRPRSIGVIGLGAGTIAAYGHPGDRIRFYEINPAVEPIARNVFTYIRESRASSIDIIPGDARTTLARSAPQDFDVLVVDAFSGDAIPLHLLTTQALALYRRHLAPGGVIAFHISNQHVDLEPAIALLAASAGMQARHVHSLANEATGEFTATWILVTDNAGFFLQPELVARAFYPDEKPGLRLWTDDYSALLPVLRW